MSNAAFWLFGTIERNQSEGLILSPSSCSGRRVFKTFRVPYSIDIAWIHKTVSSDAALVIERCSYAIISTSRLCPVQDYSTVCKELIAKQQITTEKKCRSFCPLIGVKSEAYSYRLRWMVWLNEAHHSFVSFFAWFGILSSGHWSCGDRLQNCTALK